MASPDNRKWEITCGGSKFCMPTKTEVAVGSDREAGMDDGPRSIVEDRSGFFCFQNSRYQMSGSNIGRVDCLLGLGINGEESTCSIRQQSASCLPPPPSEVCLGGLATRTWSREGPQPVKETMEDLPALTKKADVPTNPQDDWDSDGAEDNESIMAPATMERARQVGVCAEPVRRDYYKEPYWNKHAIWESRLHSALESCVVFKQCSPYELQLLVNAMEIHLRSEDDNSEGCFVRQGEQADSLYVVLAGTVDCYREMNAQKSLVGSRTKGAVIDETAVLFATPRALSLYARGTVTLGKLNRVDYMHLFVRLEIHRRIDRQELLRRAGPLEMMLDEHIAKLADVLKTRTYQPGEAIITQGEEGRHFFIMQSGEAYAQGRVGDDVQKFCNYYAGDLFGEVALLKNCPRAASVIAHTRVEVLYLSRGQFERLLGPMSTLQAQQYLTDPRKLISDFYSDSDTRGPRGTLRQKGVEPDESLGKTTWFAVYRPTSRESICKMLSGMAVGKGLNIKGKSAKQGLLSGFVPFVQISDNKHKAVIEQSPPDARLLLYFKKQASREEARKALTSVMAEMPPDELPVSERRIEDANDYDDVFGLNLPEPLLREAFIMRPDLSPWMGWETGRRSEPAFMDMNLHCIRDASEPKVVLLQHDDAEPMNPRGLLVAYAEEFVKPVVSDFDTFLVASTSMSYEPLPAKQAELIMWTLDRTREILQTPNDKVWTSRWLEVLKAEAEKGFHPQIPKYGFGDPTSYTLIEDVVKETAPCGAIRHGAECSNFYFPQELDDEYLVVWCEFPDKPWKYMTEEQVRKFLLERIHQDGFTFPINPVWPVRDKGWLEILSALKQTGQNTMQSWFPPQSGIVEKIEALAREFPNGFAPIRN